MGVFVHDEPLTTTIDLDDKGENFHLGLSRPLSANHRQDRQFRAFVEGDLNGHWKVDDEAFVIPVSTTHCELIAKQLPLAHISEEVKLLLDNATLLLRVSERRMEKIQAFLKDGTVSPIAGHQFKREPLPHQMLGTELVVEAPFLGLQLDMGLGKTKIVVDALSILASRSSVPIRAVIICPRAVLINWVREFALDTTVSYAIGLGTYISQHLRHKIDGMNVIGHALDEYDMAELMLKLISQPVKLQVMIVTLDLVSSRLDVMKGSNFHFAAVDESQKIKNPGSKRTKGILEFAEQCGRRVFMTGTVVTQSAKDLWPQYEFLAPKQALLGYQNPHAFARRYVKTGGNKGQAVIGHQNLGGLMEYTAQWSFTLCKEQCMNLPEKTFLTREVQMSEEQAKVYKQVAEQALASIESLGVNVTVQNVLVQYMKLAQVTAGYIKAVDEVKMVAVDKEIPGADVKIRELLDVLEAVGNPKCVVWTRFTLELKRVADALRKEGIKFVEYHGSTSDVDRDHAVESFNKDESVKVFLGTQQAGGVGINLTAASYMVYLSNTFSLGDRLQSEDRIHRVGQTKPCTYVDIICEDTIDELIIDKLNKKRDVADFFNDRENLVTALKDFLSDTIKKKD